MSRSVMLNSLNVEATDKISILLRDTVLLLCRNGFNFQLDIKVQGLIAITLDEKEVYLVKFDESSCKSPSNSVDGKHDDEVSCEMILDDQQTRRQRKRRKSNRQNSTIARMTFEEEEEERIEQQQHDFNAPELIHRMIKNPDHDPPPIDFHPLTSDLQKRPIEDVEDSSTVSIKEEEGVAFDLTAFNEHDILNNNNNEEEDDTFMRNQLPMGMIGMGDGNHGNDMLWPMPAMVSGRGRRARRSGQKMYSCEHPGCGLSFYRSYTLYRHQRLKHGQRLVPSTHIHNKSNPVFKCPVEGCGQIFIRASNLEKHSRDVHLHNDQHLMNPENFLGKSELERYEESDLLFEGIDYGLSSR